jgi:hypothetical protein
MQKQNKKKQKRRQRQQQKQKNTKKMIAGDSSRAVTLCTSVSARV